MPKKKPGRNGYWQFVLETRDKMGGKRMSKEELESYTGKKWAVYNILFFLNNIPKIKCFIEYEQRGA
jgi:hypothetical protein